MKKQDKTKSSTYEASKKIRNEWDINPVTKVQDKGKDDPHKQRRKDKNDQKTGQGNYENS